MFRLKLVFKLEESQLPAALERPVVSFLKAAAQKESQAFFDELFGSDSPVMKTYCMSYYLNQARFKGDRIYLGEPGFTMFFSDGNLEELIRFYNAFLKMRNVPYPLNNNSMTLNYVSIQPLKEIQDREIIVKMLSPLLVREHDKDSNKDRYYLYYEEGFAENLRRNTEYFIKTLGLNLSAADFSIQPLKGKKVVVPSFGKRLDGNLGIFKLTGSPELLTVLYASGLGSRRGEGRGAFEIVM